MAARCARNLAEGRATATWRRRVPPCDSRMPVHRRWQRVARATSPRGVITTRPSAIQPYTVRTLGSPCRRFGSTLPAKKMPDNDKTECDSALHGPNPRQPLPAFWVNIARQEDARGESKAMADRLTPTDFRRRPPGSTGWRRPGGRHPRGEQGHGRPTDTHRLSTSTARKHRVEASGRQTQPQRREVVKASCGHAVSLPQVSCCRARPVADCHAAAAPRGGEGQLRTRR